MATSAPFRKNRPRLRRRNHERMWKDFDRGPVIPGLANFRSGAGAGGDCSSAPHSAGGSTARSETQPWGAHGWVSGGGEEACEGCAQGGVFPKENKGSPPF